MKIAIDGTAASGKGTLSDNLSKELKLPRLDTGLLYRKVAFSYIKYEKIIPTPNTLDNSILKNILNDFDINGLNPETLSHDLFGNLASMIGKLDFVRNKLKMLQIEFVDNNNVRIDASAELGSSIIFRGGGSRIQGGAQERRARGLSPAGSARDRIRWFLSRC